MSVVPPRAAGDWTCPLNVLVTLYAKYRQAPPIFLVADLNFTRFLLVFLSLTPHSQRGWGVSMARGAPPLPPYTLGDRPVNQAGRAAGLKPDIMIHHTLKKSHALQHYTTLYCTTLKL